MGGLVETRKSLAVSTAERASRFLRRTIRNRASGGVGSLPLRGLVPVGAVDLDRFLEGGHVQGVLLEAGEAVEDAVPGVAVLSEPFAERQPEEVCGLHQGMEGQGVEAEPQDLQSAVASQELGVPM